MQKFERYETGVNGINNVFIKQEIEGIYGSDLLRDMGEIIRLYDIYEHGAKFVPNNTNGDYIPAELRCRKSASLIDKEARFLFSKRPDIKINIPYSADNASERDAAKSAMSILQSYIDAVFANNHFYAALLKAAKDCFIGRRVAWFVVFDEDKGEIDIDFVPSLEFAAEYDGHNPFKLSKIFTFYNINNVDNRSEQRIYKKKYWLEDGACYVSEEIYNGAGEIVETVIPKTKTRFSYIPAGVIVNEGLTGDVNGRSDIEAVADYESYYSKIVSADIDAEQKSMYPIIYTRDMNPETTAGLSSAAGSFWDFQTDPNLPMNSSAVGEVNLIEPSMNYTTPVNTTLERLNTNMHEILDIPDINAETLKGTITSGKTLKALYYPLLVRCDEKMHAWTPAIEQIVRCLIDGAMLYPNASRAYTDKTLPDVAYSVTVENQYPLPDDEESEKQIDMQEVINEVRSKQSYILKWNKKTSDEADEELQKIIAEKTMLENAEAVMPPMDNTV